MLRTRKLALASAAVGVVAIGAATAIATTGHTGSGISDIQVVTAFNGDTTTSTTFEPISGATTTITVDGGDAIRARFSGETVCGAAGSPAGICSVQVVARELRRPFDPRSGTGLAFDSTTGGSDPTPEVHSFEWVSGPLDAGTYTVRAQFAVDQAGLAFGVDDYTFSVEEIDTAL